MTDNDQFRVKVQGDDIIVTMKDTGFGVVYRKPNREPGLVAKGDYFPDEQKGPIARAEFLVGIPFAWAHVKLAGLAFWPIGKIIVLA